MPQKWDLRPYEEERYDLQPYEEEEEDKFVGPIKPQTISEPTDYWGGVRHSMRPGGESDIAALKGSLGYAQGALYDLPSSLWGAAKTVAGLMSMGNPQRQIDTGLELWEGLKQIPSHLAKTYSKAATEPQPFGRTVGQLTGQAAITEGLFGKIPAVNRMAKTGVRKLGTPVTGLGEAAIAASPFAPFGFKLKVGVGGYGLKKLGQRMQRIGASDAEVMAQDVSDFFGGSKSQPRREPTEPNIKTGQEDIWDQMLREERPQSDVDALREFYGGSKSASVPPVEPTVSGGRPDIWDAMLREELPREPTLTENFGERLGTIEEPGGELFGGPTGQEKLPFYEPRPPANPLGKNAPNTVVLQEPTPLKIQELIHRGYEPAANVNPDGSLTMTRTGGVPETPTVTKSPELPDTIPGKGLGQTEIDLLKGMGYKPVVKNGKLISMVKEFIESESGTFDWKQTWTNLRQLLGRDPSAAEIEAAMARQVRPGERTGDVAQFNKPPEPIDPLVISPEQQSFLDRVSGGKIPESWPPTEGGLDVSKLRQQNVLGPRAVEPNDMNMPFQMGQQELPMGPSGEMMPRELMSDAGIRPPEDVPMESQVGPQQTPLEFESSTSSLIQSDPMTTNYVETIQKMGIQSNYGLNKQVMEAQNLILKSMRETLSPKEIQRFHQLADTIQSNPNLSEELRMNFKFDQYQLPDGKVINVDATASKSEPTIDYQMRDGKMVKATRLPKY